MDGRGVPLSLIVTGANVHDSKKLAEVLDAVVIDREDHPVRRNKHLCADAGYYGQTKVLEIEERHYITHIVSRGQEADQKRRNPSKKARRWVVEVCHS